MANVQQYFFEFFKAIKLDDENDDLKKSKEAIKKRLQTNLDEYLDKAGIARPTYFDQGSYSLGTGVKPLTVECSYDIDVGVKFNLLSSDYPDPTVVKKWLLESLDDHTTQGSQMKEPCVRVIYSEDKKEKYHVDLAVYATEMMESSSLLKLARGKLNSAPENKKWEKSEPELLKQKINSKYLNAEEQAQFRRVVCYLKRWKDTHFAAGGNSKPRGIALTMAAYYYFYPVFDIHGNPDDLSAIKQLVSNILGAFKSFYVGNQLVERLEVLLLVEPHNDLFGKMTDNQIASFKKKLQKLHDNVNLAISSQSVEEALNKLAESFGEDFPAADVSKVFWNITRPNLGVRAKFEVYGDNLATADIPIYGYIKIPGKDVFVPISSDRKVLPSGYDLKFETPYRQPYNAVLKWRVVNTGAHAQAEEAKGRNAFRGKLHSAKKSDNPSITFESTQYTGKHWIECFAFMGGRCIAKSKRFFVNIYNPEYPNYD